eukprot:CAMPEP_0182607324 /NCGR_PEP_ID=MMETSP1330-20130603/2031_1 /TAXON_ID=464278 /ORGANISM="Picochlorum sp., Strain RCC944" /LENGTH=524 /DNA_ID=CAMNT_0024825903 /DNA_START=122 /DNA_END=1696 /DNA_ORIENTATION=-
MTIKAKGRVRRGSLFSATVFFSAVCLLALLSTVAASEDHGNVSLRQVKQSEDEEESIWEPLPTNAKGIAGLVLAAFFIMVAAGSGLGGGGVLVPLYISFLDLNPMHAVALSNMTIFGSSLMNVIVNSRRKHPCANRKMINWEIVLLLEPCSILGTVIGGIMNKTFPVMLSVVLMVAFLTLTTIRTFRKAVKLYEIESSAFMRLGTIDDLSADIPAGHSRSLSLSPTLLPSHSEPLLSPASETRRLCSSQRAMSYLDFSVDERNLMSPEYDSGDPNQSVRYMKAAKVNNTELTSIYMSESKTFQFCMIPMIVLQCIVIALFIVKQQSKCGSILFWAITFSFLPITILFMFGICKYLSKVHEERVTNGYEFVPGDVKWNRRMMTWYPPIAVFAGIIASWFGVGGGTVKGPLLMELGILPEVTTATSSTMMLFTTISAVSGYIAMNRLLVYYGILMFFISTICTLIAQLALKSIITKLSRPSLVIFLFATVCLLGALGMLLTSKDILLDIVHGHFEGFRSICSEANK